MYKTISHDKTVSRLRSYSERFYKGNEINIKSATYTENGIVILSSIFKGNISTIPPMIEAKNMTSGLKKTLPNIVETRTPITIPSIDLFWLNILILPK